MKVHTDLTDWANQPPPEAAPRENRRNFTFFQLWVDKQKKADIISHAVCGCAGIGRLASLRCWCLQWAYGFESRHPHQTNEIRIRFRLGTGSDFWYSLRDTKISTSATGSSAGPPPSREAHGKRSRQGKARRRYHYDAAAVLLLIRPEFPEGGKICNFSTFPVRGNFCSFSSV